MKSPASVVRIIYLILRKTYTCSDKRAKTCQQSPINYRTLLARLCHFSTARVSFASYKNGSVGSKKIQQDYLHAQNSNLMPKHPILGMHTQLNSAVMQTKLQSLFVCFFLFFFGDLIIVSKAAMGLWHLFINDLYINAWLIITTVS